MVLRPFVGLVVFMLAWWISKLLYRWIPEGKIRRVLYSRLPTRWGR